MADVKENVQPTDVEILQPDRKIVKPKWYRSTLYNAIILGTCNLLAPGIWGAMNSLGAGGAEKPYLVNTANALTFCLMVLSCIFSSIIVRAIGIKWTLIIGTIGYSPYAAGLYTNNRYGNEWFVLVGAALCGLSAGIFWMSEAAVALAYPEPYNQGRFLGLWLSFRLGGQILGGAINLGINAKHNKAGKVSYTVFLVFVALQACAPLAGLLLNKPNQVQRKDGVKVHLKITEGGIQEFKATWKLFTSKNFLLIIPLICQAVYSEAVIFTYQSQWFSVRARALGSFLSGIVALTAGNILGAFLDRTKISLHKRARWSFFVILGLQGAWWIWATVLVTEFHRTQPSYDWVDPGFGRGFALFLFVIIGFQLNYMFLYFIVGNIAKDEAEVIRIAGLLRATESAAQAVSYGLDSIDIFGQVAGVYLNFGLWGISLFPAWLVIRQIGFGLGDRKVEREHGLASQDS
ncbi:major facilitator superfamily domain-containing protein [Phyllosticta citribraziliensis]|uniref:Major facilitator superfamily domain-containing protein n=1 Tax=Phyllosticta citribraziliensis TaxID=989973 RepID=A0ABR1LQN3_9PEZI